MKAQIGTKAYQVADSPGTIYMAGICIGSACAAVLILFVLGALAL